MLDLGLHAAGMSETFLVFVVAILVTASFTGVGPSLLAIFVSALIGTFCFSPPIFAFGVSSSKDWYLLLLFLVCAIVATFLIEAVRAPQRTKADPSRAAQGESEQI